MTGTGDTRMYCLVIHDPTQQSTRAQFIDGRVALYEAMIRIRDTWPHLDLYACDILDQTYGKREKT